MALDRHSHRIAPRHLQHAVPVRLTDLGQVKPFPTQALTRDGGTLLTTLIESGEVAEIDTRTQTLGRRLRIGNRVEGLTIDPTGAFGFASAQADDTIVVVTSDHGEQLGDHWLVEKLGFFDQSYRIPLIVRWPGMQGPAGRVVDAFTENVDVLPTLVDLCGGTVPEFCDGASLRPFLL